VFVLSICKFVYLLCDRSFIIHYSFPIQAMSFNTKTSVTAAPPRTSQYVGPYILQKTLGKGQTGIYIFLILIIIHFFASP
jgi:hypothetical protein